MSVVGSCTNMYACECGTPVLLLAAKSLFSICFFFVMVIGFFENFIHSWNDLTLPIHSTDVTFAEIIFMTSYSFVWKPFFLILASCPLLFHFNTMIKQMVQNHHERCFCSVRTNRRRRTADDMLTDWLAMLADRQSLHSYVLLHNGFSF